MKDLSNEHVIHTRKNNIEYLQFKKLVEYKSIITHAYSLGIDRTYRTSRMGKKVGEEELNIAMNNYKELCNEIGINYKNLIPTVQDHTGIVMSVKEKFDLYNDIVDGLCTNLQNKILASYNADCILLIFFDPIKKVIANTHSGWKGTLQRISIKTVDRMQEEYNCNPEDIICCICPSIRKCHFEVELDVKEKFETEFKDIEAINDIIEETVPNKKWNIDTILINKILLQRRGLRKENIIDSGICSVCNKDIIHSYRVEGKGYGLNTAIVTLQ